MAARRWTTPQLVVLLRGEPEESVLRGCKHAQAGTPLSSTIDNQVCTKTNGCGSCNSRGGS
jgi:hypothetical protein